ncbi:MAG: hypothetical protein BM556_01320 [Bacteriovorax sp. MedPE-SWde]|nr:MAG: hypothetical protein BM556_01320 [Bacteriovorax sp. MedPE-SWde]
MNSFDHHLVLAPIRGITNYIYRNAITRSFGGADSALAPYIVTKSDGELNKRQLHDVTASINLLPTVGQVLTKEIDQFLEVAHIFEEQGVEQVNLNMGCPYPMVANRTKGSGLLLHPEKLDKLLNGIQKDCPLPFSVKIRLGREDCSESDTIIPIINNNGIDDVTVHARIGKQIYKGEVDLDGFQRCLDLLPNPPCYNGDIKTVEHFNSYKKRFPTIKKWMIGRGLLSNPALLAQIKGETFNESAYREKLITMHNEIAKGHLEYDNGRSDFLNKMKGQWFYLSETFEDTHKVFKKIKKSRTIEQYDEAIEWIFEQDISLNVLNG